MPLLSSNHLANPLNREADRTNINAYANIEEFRCLIAYSKLDIVSAKGKEPSGSPYTKSFRYKFPSEMTLVVRSSQHSSVRHVKKWLANNKVNVALESVSANGVEIEVETDAGDEGAAGSATLGSASDLESSNAPSTNPKSLSDAISEHFSSMRYSGDQAIT